MTTATVTTHAMANLKEPVNQLTEKAVNATWKHIIHEQKKEVARAAIEDGPNSDPFAAGQKKKAQAFFQQSPNMQAALAVTYPVDFRELYRED